MDPPDVRGYDERWGGDEPPLPRGTDTGGPMASPIEATERSDLTLGDFAGLPEEEGWHLELSAGRLVREPAPGARHGNLAVRFAGLLHRVGEAEGLGVTFVHTGFALSRDPDTVRVPDVAFVSRERAPEEDPGDGFWELAPDLVVEIVSPSNSASDIQTKAVEYLEAGIRLLWIVDPATRTVTAYRSRSDIRILREGDVLEAGEVLPGLSLELGELFA